MPENRFIMKKRSPTLYLIFISGFCSFTVGSSDFHLTDISKTYIKAKSHCREMYTDLATVSSLEDMNNLITLVSTTSTVRAWIGLEIGDVWTWHWSWPDQKLDFLNWKAGEPQKKNQDACAGMDRYGEWFESDCGIKRTFVCHDPWKWSDGSNSSFRFWKPFQPNHQEDQNCVAAIFKDNGQWNDLKCGGRHKFVCRGARKSTPTTPNQSTQETFTTDQMPTNMTTLPSTSSQGVITTFHFTVVASTGQPNTTNVTNEVDTTATEWTTPNTTDVVYSTSSAELNNATTEMSTVTATQLPPATNVHVTESSQSLPPGNLILVQQNMTWIEAMSYCREHHIDLVHITSEDIQEKVAEKAKNATSSHVWLGLHYTCKFNFWFWTRSTTGCYQNWAPGQGSEGKYDCGVTGAIEATGRQQWVGLPETEKLNFICHTCAG
ncbi:C-type mannose receptor 2-like isoform X2 [Trachinotus anak]|uniref:C-type mannose receptor 2-like isoform X2 n=1 Tax=Trachinotus anak TaxID=443729 RepID=UPI0039F1EF05